MLFRLKALDLQKELGILKTKNPKLAERLSNKTPEGTNYCLDICPRWFFWFQIKIRHRHPEKFVDGTYRIGVYCDVKGLQDTDSLLVGPAFCALLKEARSFM